MADKPDDKFKDIPKYPGPGPDHPRCKCVIYGLDDITVAELKAIAREIDRMMMAPLKDIDPGNLIHYYSTLPDHFKKIN